MSASFCGQEVKYTKRSQLGHAGWRVAWQLLLMTGTPHIGREKDFQLFMGILNADRFEGRFREGDHKMGPSDMMRCLVKEELYRINGTPSLYRLLWAVTGRGVGIDEGGGWRTRVVSSAAASSGASRRDGDGLSDDRTAAGVFVGYFPVGFDHHGDGFAKVRPRLFEGGALSIGTGKLLDEGDVAVRNLLEHCHALYVHN